MKRGEVVEVDWPFTDLTGTKPRPAVVVQDDYVLLLIRLEFRDSRIYRKSLGVAGFEPATSTV